MKNLNLKTTMLSPVFNTIQGHRNVKVSGRYFYEEKEAVLNLFWQLSVLLITLPVITTILVIWFKTK